MAIPFGQIQIGHKVYCLFLLFKCKYKATHTVNENRNSDGL